MKTDQHYNEKLTPERARLCLDVLSVFERTRNEREGISIRRIADLIKEEFDESEVQVLADWLKEK